DLKLTATDLPASAVRHDAAQALSSAAQARARANIGLDATGLFIKADPRAVAFVKTGNGTVSIKPGTIIEVDGSIFTYAVATAISMPTLAPGNDPAFWIKPDGEPVATLDHVAPPLPGSRKIGGGH